MKKTHQWKRVTYFKRWTRKGYAAFNSFHKVVVISTISLACSFLAKPTQGHAQIQPDTLLHTLEEVQITADDPLHNEMQPLLLQSVIINTDIDRSPIQSLNELLDYFTGLDIRQRGLFGTQADISYRGGTFDQTVLMLNGINFTDPQTGHYSLNLPIPPDIIRSIELYKNTTAALYGTAPFSGALNIQTLCDTVPRVIFHLTGGMYGLLQTGAALNMQTGRWSHMLAFSYGKSDGYIKNTDYTNVSAFYQNKGRLRSGTLDFQIGYNDKKYGANGFYSLKYPDQFESTQTLLTSLKWNMGKTVRVTPAIYYRLNKDCFELVKGQDPTKNNYHITQLLGLQILTNFHSIAGTTTFSADMRWEEILSTSLGDPLTETVPIHAHQLSYKFGKTRLQTGISAAHIISLKRFTANVALLLQYFGGTRKIYPLPACNLHYRFKPLTSPHNIFTSSVEVSFAGSARQPTFTDLYYKTGDVLGNNALQPEQAYTLEGSTLLKLYRKNRENPYLMLNIALFNRWGRSMIDYIKKENEEKWHSVNHTNISFTGVEAELQLLPPQIARANYPLQNLTLQYSYLHSDKEADGYQSRYVLDHLIHRLSVQITHRIYKGLSISGNFSFNSRKGTYKSFAENPIGQVKSYPNYALLDVRLQYSYRAFSVYVEASNLLNVKYYDIGDLVQPGTWARIGIKFDHRLQSVSLQ